MHLLWHRTPPRSPGQAGAPSFPTGSIPVFLPRYVRALKNTTNTTNTIQHMTTEPRDASDSPTEGFLASFYPPTIGLKDQFNPKDGFTTSASVHQRHGSNINRGPKRLMGQAPYLERHNTISTGSRRSSYLEMPSNRYDEFSNHGSPTENVCLPASASDRHRFSHGQAVTLI